MIEQSQENIYKTWLVEFQGKIFLSSKNMPEEVYDIIQMYRHYFVHGKNKEDPRVRKAREEFKNLTGGDIEDFINYKKDLEKKLKEKIIH